MGMSKGVGVGVGVGDGEGAGAWVWVWATLSLARGDFGGANERLCACLPALSLCDGVLFSVLCGGGILLP